LTDDRRLAQAIERLLAALPVWDNRLVDLTNQWQQIYWALHQFEDQNPRLLTLYPTLFDLYGELVAYRLSPDEWDGLVGKLGRLPANLEHRARLAALYDAALRGLPVRTLARPPGSILWRYPLLAAPEQRNDLLAHLWAHGIHDTTRWYPSLRYMAGALAGRDQSPLPPTPHADRLGAAIINLPLGESVAASDVEHTAALIRDFYAG
jgi:hypothetical protein